jgi:hypothetical protein
MKKDDKNLIFGFIAIGGVLLLSSFKASANPTTPGIKEPEGSEGNIKPIEPGGSTNTGGIKTYNQVLANFTGDPECSNYDNFATCIDQDDSQTIPAGTIPSEAMYYFNFGGLTRTDSSKTYWAGEYPYKTPEFTSNGVIYRYRAFKNAFYGLAAVIYNVAYYFSALGLNSIRQIATRWTGGANTQKYIDILTSITGWSPDFKIAYTKENLLKIVMAIIIAENSKSRKYIDPKSFQYAYNLAKQKYSINLPA